MKFTILDGGIVALLFIFLTVVILWVQRYSKSVADFLAANRCAGRYLLTVAGGAVGLGFISIVAYWEVFYKLGFSGIWWQLILMPAVGMVVALSGFVSYRFRATKAMTMAEFFELRYSRRFRIFAGFVAWASGILNYGIFPSIAGRFLIYFIGLPVYTVHFGGLDINLTLAAVMGLLLAMAVTFTIAGGQITVMVTEFCQGQLINAAIFVVVLVLMFKISWSNIVGALSTAPAGQSMLDPFDIKDVQGFNMWYFIFQIILMIYGFMAWQGSQAYNCSAKSPHEARMASVLVGWRNYIYNAFYFLIPVCVFVVMKGNYFPQLASAVSSDLTHIPDLQVREQLTVPVGLLHLLPVGVVGLLCASIIAGNLATDGTYLHSWGVILVQDVIMPMRGKPFSPKVHLMALRCSIIGIACFAFFFSLFFNLKEFIFMYFAITGAIYLGGAGAVIIGGLYWRRGTTAGAWAAMLSGAVCSVSGIILQNIAWPHIPALKANHPALQFLPDAFPLTGMEMAFIFAVIASSSYVAVSLLTKPDETLDFGHLLHRDENATVKQAEPAIQKWKILEKIGIGREFTLTDKIIAIASLVLTSFWILVFVLGNVIHSRFAISKEMWGRWWALYLVINMTVAIFAAVWLFIGGIFNFKDLVVLLKQQRRDSLDDGFVIGHKRQAELDGKHAVKKPGPGQQPEKSEL